MSDFKFHEVVIGIIVGDIEEGTKFKTSTGFDAVYKNGMLSWLTSGGYIGSPVAVTQEILGETFSAVNPVVTKELTFFDALQYIAEGDKVTAIVEGREYSLDTLKDIDTMIEHHEYFTDLYKARFTVELESSEVNELPFMEVELPLTHGDTVMLFLDSDEDTHDSSIQAFEKTAKLGKKLSKQEAWEILNLYHFTKQSVEHLANRYEVSTRMIYYILDGTHWTEVYELFHNDYDVVKDDYIK